MCKRVDFCSAKALQASSQLNAGWLAGPRRICPPQKALRDLPDCIDDILDRFPGIAEHIHLFIHIKHIVIQPGVAGGHAALMHPASGGQCPPWSGVQTFVQPDCPALILPGTRAAPRAATTSAPGHEEGPEGRGSRTGGNCRTDPLNRPIMPRAPHPASSSHHQKACDCFPCRTMDCRYPHNPRPCSVS